MLKNVVKNLLKFRSDFQRYSINMTMSRNKNNDPPVFVCGFELRAICAQLMTFNLRERGR
jgi:hypothetical protein